MLKNKTLIKFKNSSLIITVLILSTALLTGCNSSDSSNSNQENQIDTNIENMLIQEELQEQIDTLESQKDDLSFPSWALELNLSEPKDMTLDISQSYQTTDEVEGFNSIHFVYQGDYDNSMQQAELLATQANIPISPEFKMAQDLIENMEVDTEQMGDLLGDMKGMVYTNYSLLESSTEDYSMAVSVNEDGSLEIDITDMVAMQEVAESHIK